MWCALYGSHFGAAPGSIRGRRAWLMLVFSEAVGTRLYARGPWFLSSGLRKFRAWHPLGVQSYPVVTDVGRCVTRELRIYQ